METQNNLNKSIMNLATAISRSKLKLILGFIAFAILISSCQPPEKAETENSKTEQADSQRIFPVRSHKVEYSTFEKYEEYTASINAWQEVHLGPNQPNQIEKILVEVGDRVSKGDVLVKLDAAAYLQTKIQFEDMKRDFMRMDTLLNYGSTSQQAYDKTKMGYDLAKTALQTMKENVNVIAPFSGVITGKYFNEGEIYSSMSPNMVTGVPSIVSLMQITDLKVKINVSEKLWTSLKKGMNAVLTTEIYPGEYFAGKVYLIYPTIDPMTKTFMVEIKIPNKDERLRPGMFAKVALNLGEIKSIIIPSSAILKQQGTNQRYVYLEQNGKAKKTVVELGNRFNENIEIVSGLNVGDMLIVSGQSGLMTGTPVKIVD